MATFKSAKNAKVRIGATTLTAKSWTITTHADELDTTNFEGSGYLTNITGITSLEASVEFDIDCDADPYDSPPNLQAGATLSSLKFYLNDTTGPYWSVGTMRVLESTCNANVKEALKGTVKLKGSGSYTYPTGAI